MKFWRNFIYKETIKADLIISEIENSKPIRKDLIVAGEIDFKITILYITQPPTFL